MDTLNRQGTNRGFLDASLELLDERETVLAVAEDTVGLDPLIHYELPADGDYTIKVQSLSFAGFSQAVYRLTLGEIPWPTMVFPPGGKRGDTVTVEFSGPNVPPGTRQTITIANEPFPLQDISMPGPAEGLQFLTLLRGDYAEHVETSDNETRQQAMPLSLPATVNGRFENELDEDWYRVSLEMGAGLLLQTTAQRHLVSPVDTVVEVFDESGKLLAENDDGRPFANECLHDFASCDSWLAFAAPAQGNYLVRVRDQGQSSGSRAVYRLSIEPLRPDFELFQWPDAVPIWGPGTTASFVVPLLPRGGFNADVELKIVGLPEGWTGSTANVPAASFRNYNGSEYAIKTLMTITAPAEAPPGAMAPFHVVAQSAQDGRVIERQAQPLSLLGNSHNDRMHHRYSPGARAVLAQGMGAWVEATVSEVSVPFGGKTEIPVRIHRAMGAAENISLTVDGPTVAAGCAWSPPLVVPAGQTELVVPLSVSPERPPGVYDLVVSRSWASDLRVGRPGPCSSLIRLRILPEDKSR
jgi:hypothetical protein